MHIFVKSNLDLALTAKDHLIDLYAVIEENREHLTTYLSWVENKTSLESLASYIEESKIKYFAGTDISFVIFHDKKLVGRIGLHYINQHNKTGIIGYWLAKAAEGKGIMTACCQKIIDYAFEHVGLERLELKAATANQRSRAVAERLGFVHEGILRKAELVNGQFHDLALYAMIRDDWQQSKRDEIHAI